ncbi:MAG: 2,4-dihydroxyhept-2-ene-1,7-dioic acid aldolase [Ectothiorhodospiraceae bacterium]|nr:2,4-dihydroxyhept-2-ene-1,7-dioic acid aldolase [Chromatiales bacterium]MCP5154839.1 2,4-dihydroxyhept-2-ene-1,7-dioic acid aldolase [Ectothiorhodospiraceae bacterium]
MRKNRLREIWKSGANTINGWLGIPNSMSAEIVARAGFDSVTIDMQHGCVPFSGVVPLLQGICQTDAVPMVRVPWNEPGITMRVLDAGAYGVICPMVNTVAEARALVSACRYPPLGARSNGPFRASLYGGADYVQHANDEILVFAMIETETAIANLPEILKVEGLDGVYVGPSDLSLSMGEAPTLAPTAKKVIDGIKKIADLTNAAGLVPGIHCDGPETILTRYEQGYRYCTLLNDARLLAMACQNGVNAVRGKAAAEAPKSY